MEQLIEFLARFVNGTKGVDKQLQELETITNRSQVNVQQSNRTKELLDAISERTDSLLQLADQLDVREYALGNSHMKQILLLGSQLRSASTAHLGNLKPVAQAAQSAKQVLGHARSTASTIHRFLVVGQATSAKVTAVPPAMVIHTSDVLVRLSDLQRFAKDWGVVVRAYGGLFGDDDPNHGVVLSLGHGSILGTIGLDAVALAQLFMVVRSAIDCVKAIFDFLKSCKSSKEQSRALGVEPPEQPDWEQAVEERIERRFLEMAEMSIDEAVQQKGSHPSSRAREGLRQANRIVLRHIKAGGTLKMQVPADASPTLRSSVDDVLVAYRDLRRVREEAKALGVEVVNKSTPPDEDGGPDSVKR